MAENEKVKNPVVTRQGAADIPLGINLYEQAYQRGVSLSAFLEEIDPSHEYTGDRLEGTDAFQRQLILAGIRPFSDPGVGIWCDTVGKFWTSERDGAAALLPEFISRVWRRASLGQFSGHQPEENGGGKRFYMSSNPVSDVMYPAFIQGVARQKQIAPAIPLATIVSLVTPIDSGVYKAFYLTDSESSRQMVRVGEGAEVPTVTLTGGDHSINVRKYGRRLLGTYETFRRMRIDRFALHIALLAVQAEVDKVKTGIDVLINGDGNADTSATSYNLTTMDTAAIAGTPTIKGYLNWRMQWSNPYNCSVVLGRSDDILSLLMMNAGSSNVMFGQIQGMFGIGGVAPISPQLSGALVGWDGQVTDSNWLGLDSRFGLEMVSEIGATLTETNRIISTQFNEIVITESLGFCVMDADAAKMLDISA